MNKDILRQALTILATVAMITVNALANILPINGQQTGAISDRFEVYFTPAGYVFSIWGLIYVGLMAYTIFQALPSQRTSDTLRAIAPWYWLSSVATTLICPSLTAIFRSHGLKPGFLTTMVCVPGVSLMLEGVLPTKLPSISMSAPA